MLSALLIMFLIISEGPAVDVVVDVWFEFSSFLFTSDFHKLGNGQTALVKFWSSVLFLNWYDIFVINVKDIFLILVVSNGINNFINDTATSDTTTSNTAFSNYIISRFCQCISVNFVKLNVCLLRRLHDFKESIRTR